jgi:hypothetical protein
MSLVAIRNRVIICLLVFVSLLPQAFVPAAGAQSGVAPDLRHASALAPPSTLLVVAGDGFTPGGLVYIAVYDRWGVEVHEHGWAIASTAVFGPNGSADPALANVPGGTIHELIDLFPVTVYGENGSQDPARGYSAGSDPVQEPSATHGPNGSQDPALGYVPAGDQATSGRVCERNLMVRAYDAEASAWSDLIDVTAGC